jgi:hypothetical protein
VSVSRKKYLHMRGRICWHSSFGRRRGERRVLPLLFALPLVERQRAPAHAVRPHDDAHRVARDGNQKDESPRVRRLENGAGSRNADLNGVGGTKAKNGDLY